MLISMTEGERKWCRDERSPISPGDPVEVWDKNHFKIIGRGVALVVAGDMVAVGFADGHVFGYPLIQVIKDSVLLMAEGKEYHEDPRD